MLIKGVMLLLTLHHLHPATKLCTRCWSHAPPAQVFGPAVLPEVLVAANLNSKSSKLLDSGVSRREATSRPKVPSGKSR